MPTMAAARVEEKHIKEKEEDGKEMRWGDAEIEPKRWWWKVIIREKRRNQSKEGEEGSVQGKKIEIDYVFGTKVSL